MSHEIESHTNADGTVESAAAFARVPAWHRLGTTLDRDLSAEDVLDTAKLGGWDVQKIPVTSALGPVNGQFVTVRTNPFTGQREHLGGSDAQSHPVVGNVYKTIQMEQCLDLLTALRGETQGQFETAGSLQNGRRVFVTTKLPEGMLIGGVDPIDRYVTLLNSHDGSGSLLILDTPVRVVCANTEGAALRNHKSKVSIWHTESADASIQRIRESLDITYAYDAALAEEFERMMQTSTSESQFVKSIRQIWPVEKDESKVRAVNAQKRREGDLVKLFLDSPTNTQIRGTRWAAYNAVTEYLDWFTPVGEKRDDARVRAERTVLPNNRVGEMKELAFATFQVPAKKAAATA
jgi:phage/plasmid-like protein (TIGR03299 family)